MYKIAMLEKENRNEIFQVVASKENVNISIIEKDYWVCFILDYLFSKSKIKDYLTFKGGTSLSKGFGIIHRFSEDIDLILDWHIFGSKVENMYLTRSKTQQEKYNDKINNLTQQFLENSFIPNLINELKELTNISFSISIDPVEKQVVNFFYPCFYKNSYIIDKIV